MRADQAVVHTVITLKGERIAATWVVIEHADDLPGQYVAHALNYGVMSQGDSVGNALDMVREAVVLCLEADLDAWEAGEGPDPAQRPMAPKEDWLPVETIAIQATWDSGRVG